MSWTRTSKSKFHPIQQQWTGGRLLPRVLPALSRQYRTDQPGQGAHLGEAPPSYSTQQVRGSSLFMQDEEYASHSERNNEKSKRMRRNADEIERYYKCTVKTCGKSYGSEGSLNQHYKLKHPEIYVSLPNVQSNLTQPITTIK
jgi:hypothetical protein